jgi:hypothetical protein
LGLRSYPEKDEKGDTWFTMTTNREYKAGEQVCTICNIQQRTREHADAHWCNVQRSASRECNVGGRATPCDAHRARCDVQHAMQCATHNALCKEQSCSAAQRADAQAMNALGRGRRLQVYDVYSSECNDYFLIMYGFTMSSVEGQKCTRYPWSFS